MAICAFCISCVSQDQKESIIFSEIDLSNHFTGYDGAFVLLDKNNNEFIIHNKEKTHKRVSPCSTFKIVNALIGLDAGVLTDENTLFSWDGSDYKSKIWNQDQQLSSAIVNSTFWYFQENARRIGSDKMQDYINRLDYGNKDISGGLTQFWEQSSLKISPIEQVKILSKIYSYNTPFSQRNVDIIKNILVISNENRNILSGKTGSGLKDSGRFITKNQDDGYVIGWFIGVVENENNTYFFATNIEGDKNAYGGKARAITLKILKEMGILK